MTLKIYQDHQQNIKGRVSSWIFLQPISSMGSFQHESHIHSYSIPGQYTSRQNTGMTISMNHTFTLTLYQVNTQVRETQV